MAGACESPGRNGQRRTGTVAGYRAHQRANETPCEPCRSANSEHKAAHYRANKGHHRKVSDAWRAANLERDRAAKRRYYDAHVVEMTEAFRQWREANPERARSLGRRNMRRRRAQIKATSQGAIDMATVAQRDGWVCQGCQEPVEPTLTYPDPQSASLDHKVPLARGGAHVEDNVQLMHWYCNVVKAASVEVS